MEASSDPFCDNEWELSKENVQPLKQGRKMANLTAALAPSSLDQTRIHREKQEFEAEIRTYKGGDPLDIWYRYIVWMSENFPKGGKDLGTLLERCITTFKDEERYRNYERYAKVWLRYTDICKDPMDIYNYMHSQQVCSGLSLFYESWALLLENLGDCKKADEVYNLGIYRNAQPLERLIKQHRAFEMRLAEKISTGMQQVCLTEDSEPQRTTLGNLRPQGRKGSVGSKRTGPATLGTKGGIGSISQIPNSTSSFRVFCDEDIGSKNSLPPSTGEWQFPPTETVIKRENTQKPGKWSNAKVSQRNQLSVPFSAGASQKPGFTVHVDDVAASHPPCTPQHVSQFDKVLSARKPEKPFVTEALKNKLQSDNECTGGQKLKVMYCKEKIYTGTEEFTFEELRAARIFARIRAGTYVKPVEDDQPENNVRYMYPKKEVYSFDGEFQWEEILAKRYFARLQRQKTSRKLQGSIQEAQPNNMPMGFVSVKQELCSSEEQMEVVSCQKSAIQPIASQGNESRLQCHSSGTQSSIEPSARRGLAFGDLSGTQLPNRDSSTAKREIPQEPSLSINSNNFTHANGARSAFQPFKNGQPSQAIKELSFTHQENAAPFQDSRLHNLSSCYDVENVHASQLNAASVSKPQSAPFGANISVHTQWSTTQATLHTTKSNTETFSHTSAANRSGDLNSSHLSAPSPTVFTKQALEEVRNMFNGPLESERDEIFGGTHQELDDLEKGFEAAFSNENTATNKTISTGFPGFVIFEEPDHHTKSEEAEDKENKPPIGSQQEAVHRPLAGILQPSVGIPTCPLETHSEEEDELEEDERVLDKENYPSEEAHKSCQAVQQQERVSEVTLADFLPDHTLASFSFATAARVASTPFSNGIEPPSLPSIPWSTIRSTVDNNQVSNTSDLAAVETARAQSCGSFTSTPSKVLSPILERSNEDSKSTNSSHSSASSRRGSCSVGASLHSAVELSRIQEETSVCHPDGDKRTSRFNPFSAEVIDEFLLKMTPPVSSYEGFFVSDKEMPRIAVHLTITLGNDDFYSVETVVGSGAFAKVYMARKLKSELEVDDVEMDDDKAVVLKVQSDSVEWEFYICRQLHQRMRNMGCSEDLHAMFMNPPSAYLYSNLSVLVDRYNSMGTLLDMINKYKLKQKSVDYYVAVYYTIALLRILETMHAVGIIHGDIKPDNLIVLDSDADSPNVAPLKLIDFGRSIDMALFPHGTTFTSNCRANAFQCIEMQEGKPWTTQIDTYGVLGTIHCVLFGDYMKVFKHFGRWRTIRSLKRHWTGLWFTMFDSLLNASVDGKQPTVTEFRQEFEEIYRMNENVATKQKRRHDILMFA